MRRIVIMGEPGSGKSTVAREIAKRLRARVLEASTAVIYPVANVSGRLPSETAMLRRLAGGVRNQTSPPNRKKAMEAFSRIQSSYSPDFIAQALHEIALWNTARETVIFCGLRGLANAEYCRLHNDFVVYLHADQQTLVARLAKDRGYTWRQALDEIRAEQTLYRTRSVKQVANLVVDTSRHAVSDTVRLVSLAIEREFRTCKRCVNTARNPAITFDAAGFCHICSSYAKHFDKKQLSTEIAFLKSLKGTGGAGYDVMVGISGGKDSTATLATVTKMGFRTLAFTFDTGYLPATTIPRARAVARQLGVDYEAIDIRPYVRKIDRVSYKKTVELYERPFSLATKNAFIRAYREGRKHYSVKCKHSPAFVRSCQLCRRLVVRAYYNEATKRGIPAVILGMNEWTNLSAAQRGGGFRVSGTRKLQPKSDMPPVHVFHLPFLLQRTGADTKRILRKLKWQPPRGEDFVESNSNSCLFARSTERMARRLLGFHPDSARLSREVTVGFISRKQALKALKKIHPYPLTPRQVLMRAGILARI